jgi:hypothetical protein
MNSLKEEVNLDIEEFLNTSKQIHNNTIYRLETLKKIKKQYKHIQKKRAKLQHKL